MKSYLDCIPCFMRQALQSARFVTDDVSVHERVLRGVLKMTAEMDLADTPPVMAYKIGKLIRELTGCDDPYLGIKRHFNEYAMSLLPGLAEKMERSDDSLDTAIRLAIAGNVIDFGPFSKVDESFVSKAVMDALIAPLASGLVDELRQAVLAANSILYLADNAGEIVFDRLLLECLPCDKITVVVKGGAVLNDALMADAEYVGITDIVSVIDNGSRVPGTLLETCSPEFRERFWGADLIISKGQANYETLSEVDANIFFLLKAKCPVIADDIGWTVGDLVLQHKEKMSENEAA